MIPVITLTQFVEHLGETNQHITRVVNTEDIFMIKLGANLYEK